MADVAVGARADAMLDGMEPDWKSEAERLERENRELRERVMKLVDRLLEAEK